MEERVVSFICFSAERGGSVLRYLTLRSFFARVRAAKRMGDSLDRDGVYWVRIRIFEYNTQIRILKSLPFSNAF